MERKIISIKQGEFQYRLGEEDPTGLGRTVNHIEFKRDGVYGVTKGAKEEAHYSIIMVNPLAEKDFVTKIIPFSKVDDLVFMIKEDQKDKGAEVADKLQKVE
jgi:hypothetical protein